MVDLTPVVTGLMLAVFTVIITWYGKGRFDALERRIDQVDIGLRAEMRAETGSVRAELRAEIGSVRAEMAGMRSDITRIALAVRAEPRPQTG